MLRKMIITLAAIAFVGAPNHLAGEAHRWQVRIGLLRKQR